MDFEPKHHIFKLGEPEDYLLFTIDFELVEIWHPKSLYDDRPKYDTIDFWRDMVAVVCEKLGKKQRNVFSHHREKRKPPFTEGLWEYIGQSSNGTWEYFMETDLACWPNFYNWQELEAVNKMREDIGMDVRWRFKQIIKHVASQGLTPAHSLYQPNDKAVENMLKVLNRRIDAKSN